jgi:hypothetical protein
MQLDRDFLVQILITLGVCVGGWLVLVAPRAGELRELERAIAEAAANPLRTDEATLTTLASRVETFREHVRSIERQNEFARDSSQMYGRIMALAKSYDVSVQRLTPGSDDNLPDKVSPVSKTEFDMTVHGPYARVAKFLEAIDELEGFVRPRMLRLLPRASDGELIVEARFICDAMAFQLPGELRAMIEGDSHAVD